MQPTTELGMNRSGMMAAEKGAKKMLENTQLTKPRRGDEQEMARVRMEYSAQADCVGSMPGEASGIKAVFMDKLGERLAFERAGTRLYDALVAKCRASGNGSIPIQDLEHLRNEEAKHFALVDAAIAAQGGDPTAQTPGADVAGVEGMGLMQVLTDPKTTLAQALHAILVAELTDNAAWEELIELATEVGADDLVPRFSEARDTEAEHLEKVREWYRTATLATATDVPEAGRRKRAR